MFDKTPSPGRSPGKITTPAFAMPLVAIVLTLAASTGRPQCPLDLMLVNPSPTTSDSFGIAVDIDGGLIVVTATGDTPGTGQFPGSGYVYDASTGALLTTLTNPVPTSAYNMGYSASISGTTVVIGGPFAGPGGPASAPGLAQVFHALTGAHLRTLSNPNPNALDRFGWSVSVSGGLAAVGAWSDDPGGVTDTGSAYVFNVTTGALVSTLANPMPASGDNFGISVAIDGNTVLVGADSDTVGSTTFAGRVFIFNATTGMNTGSLENPSPSQYDEFGEKVAIHGDRAVVGTGNKDVVYVFDIPSRAVIRTINNPAPGFAEGFGDSVDIHGDLVVISAPTDDGGGVTDAGTAYIFNVTTGALVATLNNPAPGNNDRFGQATAIQGATAVIGTGLDDPGGVSGAGSAVTFTCPALVPTATPGASPTPAPQPTSTPTPLPPTATPTPLPPTVTPTPLPPTATPTPLAPTATPTPLPPTPTPTPLPPTATPTPLPPTATPTPLPPTATPTPVPCCPGDADNSGSFVDANDFIAVQANFGADNGIGGPGDADCGGSFVDANDFIAVQAAFGSDCG